MTDLAETIERLERGIQRWSLDGHLSKADAEALLATARRVQAIQTRGTADTPESGATSQRIT